MHTLHVTYRPDGKGHLRAVKAIREASRALITPLSLRDAKAVADHAMAQGYALVGVAETPGAVDEAMRAILAIADGTLDPFVDVPEERVQAAVEAFREVEEVEVPEVRPDRQPTLEGYDLALVLLGNSKGLAADAMQSALSLKRVTGDVRYDEALRALARVYPFVGDVLKQNGLWPS